MGLREAAEPLKIQVKATLVLQFIVQMFKLFWSHYPSAQTMWLSRCTCVTCSADAIYQSSVLTCMNIYSQHGLT